MGRRRASAWGTVEEQEEQERNPQKASRTEASTMRDSSGAVQVQVQSEVQADKASGGAGRRSIKEIDGPFRLQRTVKSRVLGPRPVAAEPGGEASRG